MFPIKFLNKEGLKLIIEHFKTELKEKSEKEHSHSEYEDRLKPGLTWGELMKEEK